MCDHRCVRPDHAQNEVLADKAVNCVSLSDMSLIGPCVKKTHFSRVLFSLSLLAL